MKEQNGRSLLADVALGAAAGLAGAWLMNQTTTAIYDHQSEESLEEEHRVRGGESAYETAAEKAARAFGQELTKDQKSTAATAIHWSLGPAAGAIYGALRHAMPSLGAGSGIAYGLLFWLAVDEGANTALGLTPPPQKFPWQAHARGVAGHLVLGATIESAFDLFDRA
ncbi:MAG: DUF1440 domain-containing protein [Thermoanaerobaculia bacterium]